MAACSGGKWKAVRTRRTFCEKIPAWMPFITISHCPEYVSGRRAIVSTTFRISCDAIRNCVSQKSSCWNSDSLLPVRRTLILGGASWPSFLSSFNKSNAGMPPHHDILPSFKFRSDGSRFFKNSGFRSPLCQSGFHVSYPRASLQFSLCVGQCSFWHSLPQYCFDFD